MKYKIGRELVGDRTVKQSLRIQKLQSQSLQMIQHCMQSLDKGWRE